LELSSKEKTGKTLPFKPFSDKLWGMEKQEQKHIVTMTWDEPLTQDRIKHIEGKFGPLAKTLSELAGLIRKTELHPMKAEPDPDQKGHSKIDCTTHQIEIEKDNFLAVSPESYGPLVRIFASAKKLRPFIELAVGKRQARKFYYDFVSTLGLGVDNTPLFLDSKIKFAGASNIEDIAVTLEDWERVRLLKPSLAEAKSTETKQNTTPSKLRGIATCFGKILEKVLYIFTKSFWDSLWERMWPK
jgi:hypothetical protein